ncbi:MAG: LysR family transcriptional regulator [Elainellaceae cyanobacterium]
MSRVDISRIKLFQLRALVAVAEYCSFSEAALHLGLTQSSISHAIASLEAELGVKLLSRGRYGATLSSVGAHIVEDARQMLQLLESIGQQAEQARGLEGGKVRLVSLRSIATHVLPRIIATFNQLYPRVKVTLTQYFYNHEIQEALQTGSADIGFLELPLNDSFQTCELVTDEYVALLPPSTVLSAPSLTWQQLQRYPLIMPDPSYEGTMRLKHHLNVHTTALPIAYEINEDSIQVGMVEQGLGIAILPYLAALPIAANIQIYSLPVPLRRPLGAALVKEMLHTPAAIAFWELLGSNIALRA